MDFQDKYSGLWLVVKPSVGLPIFFLTIVITSLLIHLAVLTHTNWMPGYYQGKTRPATTSMIVPAPSVSTFG